MSKPALNPIPEGMHSLTPHLVCAGASDAIAFYTRAFGALEQSRLPGPGGALMHAQIRIGDSPLMLVDENKQWGTLGPLSLGGSPVTIHLYVADADAVFAQAIAAGATAKMAPADMFWGDRYGVLVDPFGHHWSIATRQRDMTAEEIAAGMQAQAASMRPDGQ